MKKNISAFLAIFLTASLFTHNGNAYLCKSYVRNDPLLNVKMDDDWYKKEQERSELENQLIDKNSDYITKSINPLFAEPYKCHKSEICNPLKNCQTHRDYKNYQEIEYRIKTDLGIIISKSYCSEIGKCIGYNYFSHSPLVTVSEDRLIDIQKDNAIFYHHFYSAYTKRYEPLFNITNFHTGSELYLDDVPHFSPDGRTMVEVRSVPQIEDAQDVIPRGYKINIYEINEYGEYKNVEPDEIDEKDGKKVTSTFLSRNPSCGNTPHFHSWKSNKEIRLSMLPPDKANQGRKMILSYDKKTKKWSCQEDLFPEFECKSYLPSSTKFSSNLIDERVDNCQKKEEAEVQKIE